MNKNMLLVAFVYVSVAVQASDQFDELNDVGTGVKNTRKPRATAKGDPFIGGRDDFRRLMPEHRSGFGDQSSALNDAREVVKSMSNNHAKVAVSTLLNNRDGLKWLLPEFRSGADSLLKKLENISLDKQKEILEILWKEVLLDALAEEEKLEQEYAKMGINRKYFL